MSFRLKKWGGGEFVVKIGVVGIRRSSRGFVVKAVSGDSDGRGVEEGDEVGKLQATVSVAPPLIVKVSSFFFFFLVKSL